MRTKTLLTLTAFMAAAAASLMLAPTQALAFVGNECGPANTASNPQLATCTGAFNPYSNGIHYNENNTPVLSQGNLQVKLSGTAGVNTVSNGLTVIGVSGLNADATLLTGSSITAGGFGVSSTTTGGGTGSITNGGTVQAGTYGLFAQSTAGGLGSVTNNGSVTVTGANALAGIYAADSATIINTGSTTINGVGGTNDISGLETNTSTSSDVGTITNTATGSVSVTNSTHNAAGFGSAVTNFGSANYTNNGALSVATTTGTAYGFQVVGGTDVTITDAQTAAAATTTSITGSNTLYGASISGTSGVGTVNFTGVALTLSGVDATGVVISAGSNDSVNVWRTTFASTPYLADMSITGSNSATGVSISGAGANAVTFTGANLTVHGGGAGATGVTASGGTTGGVSFTPTGGAAAISVTAAGGAATGVSLGGSGALTAAIGDTLNVTNTAGSASGLAVNGGTTQTVTLSHGLTVSATSTGVGLSLNGASALSTAHISGTVGVSTTGNVELYGIYAAGNLGGLTIDGAPTINVSGAGPTFGVYELSGTGATSATLGDVTTLSTTTTQPAVGVALLNSGAVTLADAGVIDVTSGGANYGAYVVNSASAGAINVTLNTVRLHGSTSTGLGYGVRAQNNSTGADTTSVIAQQVSTAGQNAVGIVGNDSTLGTGTVTVGSVVAGVHAGGVSTTGANSPGISFSTGAGKLTITNNGLVSTTGANSPAISGSASGAGGVTVNNWQVTTANSGSLGVNVQTSGGAGTIVSNSVITTGAANSGAIALTTNGGAASVTSTTATTSGTGSTAIVTNSAGGATTIASTTASTTGGTSLAISATSTTGAIGVTSGVATTTGSGSSAIATSTAGGATTITSTTASTTGATSPAISAVSTTGAIGITSGVASTTGASSPAISAASTTGAITIAATQTTATGGTSDAIAATASSTGNVIVNLADGGATSSTGGNGVLVNTGGSSTINVGSTASTATLSGGAWGVNSTAASGTTLNIHGSVTGGLGAAIRLAGGPDAVNNFGVINGFVNIVSTSDVFTNSGTWNAFGSNSTFDPPGVNILNNTGVININPNAATASTYTFLAPGIPLTLNNSGIISLQQGAGGTPHTGDVLDIGNAIYTGSGGAQLLIDANLGNAAVGASGAQTADKLLVQTGSVAGSTTIAVRDLGVALPGAFNFTGIPVVVAGSSSANAFSLAGGAINKGYVQYRLTQSASTYYLVGLPSSAAFEIGRTGYEAQSYWRRSGDVWSDQMRENGLKETQGVKVWAQASAAGDTQKSNPTYQVTAINTFTFKPDLDIQNQWSGAQFGVDYGMGHWGYGLTAGFGQQIGRFKANGDHLNINGANIGIYARYENAGFYFDAMAKYDGYTVNQKSQMPAFGVDFNGSTIGGELQSGYRWTRGGAFVEPAVSLSWTTSSLNAFNNPAAGAKVNFDHADSLYGNAGLRAGQTLPYGEWTVTPYAGAYVQGEMSGKNSATVTAGGNALQFADTGGRANGRLELGVSGHEKSGLEFSAVIDGTTGGALSGVSGRVGLAYHW